MAKHRKTQPPTPAWAEKACKMIGCPRPVRAEGTEGGARAPGPTGPTGLQTHLRAPPRCPRWSPKWPRRAPTHGRRGSRQLQYWEQGFLGRKSRKDRLETVHEGPKRAPRRPNRAPRRPQDGPGPPAAAEEGPKRGKRGNRSSLLD
eukprot:262058-Pyramimonas_sp.AAC.1